MNVEIVLQLGLALNFSDVPRLRCLKIGCAALALLASGCMTTRDKRGTEHHLVLGFGVISVKEAPNRALVIADSRVIGFHGSDQPGIKAGLGYSAATVSTVSNGAEDIRARLGAMASGRSGMWTNLLDVVKEINQQKLLLTKQLNPSVGSALVAGAPPGLPVTSVVANI